jgi:hypothetical protein
MSPKCDRFWENPTKPGHHNFLLLPICRICDVWRSKPPCLRALAQVFFELLTLNFHHVHFRNYFVYWVIIAQVLEYLNLDRQPFIWDSAIKSGTVPDYSGTRRLVTRMWTEAFLISQVLQNKCEKRGQKKNLRFCYHFEADNERSTIL